RESALRGPWCAAQRTLRFAHSELACASSVLGRPVQAVRGLAQAPAWLAVQQLRRIRVAVLRQAQRRADALALWSIEDVREATLIGSYTGASGERRRRHGSQLSRPANGTPASARAIARTSFANRRLGCDATTGCPSAAACIAA